VPSSIISSTRNVCDITHVIGSPEVHKTRQVSSVLIMDYQSYSEYFAGSFRITRIPIAAGGEGQGLYFYNCILTTS
jgi:hypothetical protein